MDKRRLIPNPFNTYQSAFPQVKNLNGSSYTDDDLINAFNLEANQITETIASKQNDLQISEQFDFYNTNSLIAN